MDVTNQYISAARDTGNVALYKKAIGSTDNVGELEKVSAAAYDEWNQPSLSHYYRPDPFMADGMQISDLALEKALTKVTNSSQAKDVYEHARHDRASEAADLAIKKEQALSAPKQDSVDAANQYLKAASMAGDTGSATDLYKKAIDSTNDIGELEKVSATAYAEWNQASLSHYFRPDPFMADGIQISNLALEKALTKATNSSQAEDVYKHAQHDQAADAAMQAIDKEQSLPQSKNHGFWAKLSRLF